MQSLEGPLGLMVKVFRRECLRVQQSERTTIHGADNMLMVLQLAMAEVHKKQYGEFMVTLSDILIAWKHLISQRLQSPTPVIPLESFDLVLDEYESFLKRSNTVDLFKIYSLYKELRVDTDPDISLSATQLFDYLSGNTPVVEAEEPPAPATPKSTPSRARISTPRSTQRNTPRSTQRNTPRCTQSGTPRSTQRFTPRRCSPQMETAVRRVFCSYLSLLVNSKNDLAMAFVLDVPNRSLGQDAFTSIKHAAREGSTSLFLAVTSFVRAIQLGGKGYAPAESNPLRKHVKGLCELVQFMDNLEEILGEVPDPSACCTRLVNTIRALLVKGRGSGDPVFIAADKVAKDLKEKIFQLLQNHKAATNQSMLGISPARPKAYAINHATALGGRDTVKLIMALLDEEALTPPCSNKADLLSEDQPALSGEEGLCVLTLYRSPEMSTGCSPVALVKRVQSKLELLKPKGKDKVLRSQFACTYTDEELPLNRVLDFPSTSQVPSCVHPAPKPKWTPVEEDPSCEDSAFPDRSASESSALQQRPENNQNRKTKPGQGKKSGTDGKIKTKKRKQAETDHPEGSENEPPKKKPPTSVKPPKKGISKTSNKKLIVGQGKLTNFFRL